MNKFLRIMGLGAFLFISGASSAKIDIVKQAEEAIQQANTYFGDSIKAVDATNYGVKEFTATEYIQHATAKSLKLVTEDIAANKLPRLKGSSKHVVNYYKQKLRDEGKALFNFNKKLSKEKPTEFELIKNTKKVAEELEYLKKFIEANKVYFETASLLNKVKKEFKEELSMKDNMKKLLSHIRVDREVYTLTKIIGVFGAAEDLNYPLHYFNGAVKSRTSQLSGRLGKIMKNSNLYKTDMGLMRKEKEAISKTIDTLSEFTNLELVKLSKQLAKDLDKNKVMLESYRPLVDEMAELIKMLDEMVYKIVETPEYKAEEKKQQKGQMTRIELNTIFAPYRYRY
ncbi:hypothetical protein A3F06_01230 [candidate division TM6 bacterium RIFCSPHIGHO2_12_FULL_36_22]|nr:MAG: hypothetical protein A3F06_01230 [candidate division TM6 bacterium RIFCSPHIGHO2_12_FULL_36_22]